jgi:hypothetical protein
MLSGRGVDARAVLIRLRSSLVAVNAVWRVSLVAKSLCVEEPVCWEDHRE